MPYLPSLSIFVLVFCSAITMAVVLYILSLLVLLVGTPLKMLWGAITSWSDH